MEAGSHPVLNLLNSSIYTGSFRAGFSTWVRLIKASLARLALLTNLPQREGLPSRPGLSNSRSKALSTALGAANSAVTLLTSTAEGIVIGEDRQMLALEESPALADQRHPRSWEERVPNWPAQGQPAR